MEDRRPTVLDLFSGVAEGKRTKRCRTCAAPFEAMAANHLYCSQLCGQRDRRARRDREHPKPGRYCRQCGAQFALVHRAGNRRHCSPECAKQSARESRSRFYERNPEKYREYHERSKARNGEPGNLERLRRRFPGLPLACQSCGEARVLDVAHRPEHRRDGAWRSKANCTPDKVWLLCPTCHARIDRMGYDPAVLGLR